MKKINLLFCFLLWLMLVVSAQAKPAVPQDNSVLQQKLADQQAIVNNPLGIAFYQPTYILPYYYTWSPYQEVYENNTPDNQGVKRQEFKAQFSFLIPVWNNILGSGVNFNAAYTELFFWQFYANSQFFRETDYSPELFISRKLYRNMLLSGGLVHESNGRGGDLERSWNRFYVDYQISGEKWLLSVKPWILIFKSVSSDFHNKDIAKYLGYERIMFAYKFSDYLTVSVQARNLEHWQYKTFEGDLSFPLTKHINGYFQVFSGYGQSLIEYDHRTNGAGIGISLSNWI
jgi:phospholipase A1